MPHIEVHDMAGAWEQRGRTELPNMHLAMVTAFDIQKNQLYKPDVADLSAPHERRCRRCGDANQWRASATSLLSTGMEYIANNEQYPFPHPPGY